MNTHARHPKHEDKRTALPNGYEIERKLVGYAYPANGNVHNPTPRYRWNLYLNGRLVDSDNRRTPLIGGARNDCLPMREITCLVYTLQLVEGRHTP